MANINFKMEALNAAFNLASMQIQSKSSLNPGTTLTSETIIADAEKFHNWLTDQEKITNTLDK